MPSLARRGFYQTVVSGVLLACSGQSLAAGFQISEQTITGLGRGFAGNGVATDDVSAVFYNPAGMTLLPEGQHFQAGGTFITASNELQNRGSSRTLLTAGGFVTTQPTEPGADGGTDTEIPVPNLYYSGSFGERLRLGFGIVAPFGLKTEYNRTWIGRYHAVESELKTVDFNPSVAYRVNDGVSVGAGVSAQLADATLSQAVFTGTPSDGFAELTGDNWAFGYNFGVLFEFDRTPGSVTRIGMSFRSKMEQEVDGEITITGTPQDGVVGAQATVDLPDTWLISVYREIMSPRWAAMFSARRTNWSRFKELRIRFADGRADAVTPENWQDTWTLGLGLQYQPNARFTLRGGYVWDQSPVRNQEFRTPRIPDSDRNWINLGASWHVGKRLNIDFGYAHIFFSDANIDNTINLVSTAPGAFTDTLRVRVDGADADLIGLGASYRF